MNQRSVASKSKQSQAELNHRFENIILTIKQQGLSLTPQRYAIIRIIAESKSHPSAVDIYNKVKLIYPMISLNTIYKNLSMLSELHQIREIKTLQDAVHFDGDIAPHGHLICESCGRIDDFEIEDSVKDGFLKLIITGSSNNFGQISGYNIELHGLCKDCLRNDKKVKKS